MARGWVAHGRLGAAGRRAGRPGSLAACPARTARSRPAWCCRPAVEAGEAWPTSERRFSASSSSTGRASGAHQRQPGPARAWAGAGGSIGQVSLVVDSAASPPARAAASASGRPGSRAGSARLSCSTSEAGTTFDGLARLAVPSTSMPDAHPHEGWAEQPAGHDPGAGAADRGALDLRPYPARVVGVEQPTARSRLKPLHAAAGRPVARCRSSAGCPGASEGAPRARRCWWASRAGGGGDAPRRDFASDAIDS